MFTTAITKLGLGRWSQPKEQSHTVASRSDYGMEVAPNGWMATYIRNFLNTGDRAFLDKLVRNAKTDFSKPIIIDFMDLSTSIGRGSIPIHIEKNQGQQLINLGIAHGDPKRSANLFQFGISNSLRFLQPQDEGPVNLHDLKVFDKKELRDSDKGGVLSSGSRLSDSLFLGAELALAYRRAGFQQNIGIAIKTDGWNRNADLKGNNEAGMEDRNFNVEHGRWVNFSEAEAYKAIEEARTLRIKFRLLGFVEPHGRHKFDAFVSGVGLHPGEATMVDCNLAQEASAAQSVQKVFHEHTRFLQDCTQIK